MHIVRKFALYLLNCLTSDWKAIQIFLVFEEHSPNTATWVIFQKLYLSHRCFTSVGVFSSSYISKVYPPQIRKLKLMHCYHLILRPHPSFAICPVVAFIAKGSSTESLAAFDFHVSLVSNLCPSFWLLLSCHFWRLQCIYVSCCASVYFLSGDIWFWFEP